MINQTNEPFPQFMNATDASGQRSRGPAVMCLQSLLAFYYFGRSRGQASAVQISGVYDEATVTTVKQLQASLGFSGDDIDGNCGPATRQRALNKIGVDLNQAFAMCRGRGRYAQADGSLIEWGED